MVDDLNRLFEEHREALYLLLLTVTGANERFLVWRELRLLVDRWRNTEAARAIPEEELWWLDRVHEAIVAESLVHFAIRTGVARWAYVQIHVEEVRARGLSTSEYLATKEAAVLPPAAEEPYTLEVDLAPFERGFPRVEDPAEIGRGVEYLNRHLAGDLFAPEGDEGEQRLLEFLRGHAAAGHPLMLNGTLESVPELRQAIRRAIAGLRRGRWADARERGLALRRLGFEPGWGASAERTLETMQLLCGVLDAPTPEGL
ncbi:MAG TPA: hypothetical protein VFQ22_03240, partial [Longimicrobiales bacterium]|nr:hypothetical protein [Longimicrobiales bacterium]